MLRRCERRHHRDSSARNLVAELRDEVGLGDDEIAVDAELRLFPTLARRHCRASACKVPSALARLANAQCLRNSRRTKSSYGLIQTIWKASDENLIPGHEHMRGDISTCRGASPAARTGTNTDGVPGHAR